MDLPNRIAQVVLLQPLYGHIAPDAHTGFAKLAVHLAGAGVLVGMADVQSCLVHVSRNMLVRAALTSPTATHALFVDSDVVPPPDAGMRLLAYSDGHDLPVVGALYFGRDAARRPMAYTASLDVLISGPVQPVLQQVGGVGLGCCLIRMDVFRTMAAHFADERWFWFNSQGGGEDTWFADRCAEIRVPIALAGDIVCGHVTDTVVTGTVAGR